jgi:hypothetical protein
MISCRNGLDADLHTHQEKLKISGKVPPSRWIERHLRELEAAGASKSAFHVSSSPVRSN